ncbi:porin [Primorskyibacter sp. S87]|uniref:porin n=1 Tax=Primorskyibacter sp. S87 TaxID=3415126 RepID=UPI003C7E8776
MEYFCKFLSASAIGIISIASPQNTAQAQEERSPLTLDLGNDVSVTFHGYVKADFIWDDGHDLGKTTSGIKNIGLPAGGPVGSFDRQQLNETRIGFDVRGPNDLFARFEGDFFGKDDSLRLRHAYIDWYGVIVGQNWTNFMSVENLADTVDFQGSLAYPFSRVPQVRYTYSGWDNISLSGSVEEDKTNKNELTYTMALRYGLESGMVRMAGLYRDTVVPGSNVNGWGVNLSAVFGLWQGGKLKANFTTGKGIADIVNAGLTGNALIIGGEAVGVNSAALTVSQQVNDKLKLAVTGDWLNLEQSSGTDTDSLSSVHLSAFFEVYRNTTLMAEYYSGRRTQGNGTKFSSDRVQLAIKYAF